jgi:hypothetical protein
MAKKTVMPMETLTSEQALELAGSFKAGALSIGQYTHAHWKELDPPVRDQLINLEGRLFHASADCINLAGLIIMENLTPVLQKIDQATQDAQNAIKTINIIHKVISIAAAVVTLANSILSTNPSAILDSLSALIDEIQRKPSPAMASSS